MVPKSPPHTEGPPPTDLSVEAIFDALQDERRRRVVIELYDCPDNTLSVSELSKRLARFEEGDNCKNRCYVALIQQHLPRLDRLDVVDYDEDEKVVEGLDLEILVEILTDAFHAVESSAY